MWSTRIRRRQKKRKTVRMMPIGSWGGKTRSIQLGTDKASSNIDSLGSIGRGLSLVEKELVLVGRVLDLKSTTGLVLGLTSMSVLLLFLLRKMGFGDAVEKMRKKSLASLTIFLSNQNLMMVFLRWRPRGHWTCWTGRQVIYLHVYLHDLHDLHDLRLWQDTSLNMKLWCYLFKLKLIFLNSSLKASHIHWIIFNIWKSSWFPNHSE